LLSPEQHRDGDTWGIRLLELVERGFAPQATVADFGSGLRNGQQEALPDVPCRGDVFHILQSLTRVAATLVQRAFHACEVHQELQDKQASYCWHHGRNDRSLGVRLSQAARDEPGALALADDVNLLIAWLRYDILAVAGPCSDDRRRLYDFVVAELRQRVPQAGIALKKVCTTIATSCSPLPWSWTNNWRRWRPSFRSNQPWCGRCCSTRPATRIDRSTGSVKPNCIAGPTGSCTTYKWPSNSCIGTRCAPVR
jgi:hypothetical protein